jgi:EAL domain-containing protein (putative c-di-GMP-specific phosphodiesterase class I)
VGLRTESELEQALDRGELRVRYQPIVETGSGRLTGFEALARWEHPHRGEIGPGAFIPIAEESGLIGRLAVDCLKIDRTFVARLDGSDPRAAIVRAILALARSLRLEVVADGVETDLQRREFEAMGCSRSQGYLFSRPLREAEARALVLADPLP